MEFPPVAKLNGFLDLPNGLKDPDIDDINGIVYS
jgi:hypothetical protein